MMVSQPINDLPKIDVNKSLITAKLRLDRVSIPGMLSTGLIEGDCNASVFAPRTALISKPSPTNHVGTIVDYVRSHNMSSSTRLLYLSGLHVEGALHVSPISILVNSEVLAATTALIYNNILLPPPLLTTLALRSPSTSTPDTTTTKPNTTSTASTSHQPNKLVPPTTTTTISSSKSVADLLVLYGDLLPPTFQVSLIAEEASVIIQRAGPSTPDHHNNSHQQQQPTPVRESSIMFDESLDASRYYISQEGTLIAIDKTDDVSDNHNNDVVTLDDSRHSASSTINIQKELNNGFINVAAITASMFQAYAGGAKEGTQDSLLSLIHISEPTRLLSISYAVFCLKKKKKKKKTK
eukprot:TRINITY_DN13190_c0_g1_i1.p2 TRINITY_DN13190_c0_g1~~TRINITY_DN13190_c0_g1_i1.p2  ORF type:complete len:352 (+),score=101.86 TRINITY_DN13190_c0_g1_i1:1339-2394(+)